MYYEFDLSKRSSDEYYDEQTIRSIPVRPMVPNNDDDNWWPVHYVGTRSYEYTDCANIDIAYAVLLEETNTSIYERIHDL